MVWLSLPNGLNYVSLPNLYVEVLIPNGTVFEDRTFREIVINSTTLATSIIIIIIIAITIII